MEKTFLECTKTYRRVGCVVTRNFKIRTPKADGTPSLRRLHNRAKRATRWTLGQVEENIQKRVYLKSSKICAVGPSLHMTSKPRSQINETNAATGITEAIPELGFEKEKRIYKLSCGTEDERVQGMHQYLYVKHSLCAHHPAASSTAARVAGSSAFLLLLFPVLYHVASFQVLLGLLHLALRRLELV